MPSCAKRVDTLLKRAADLLSRVEKVWTDEARLASAEARRARRELPGHLESLGYREDDVVHHNPHTGDWTDFSTTYVHSEHPHKELVVHSKEDAWELHDLKRQKGSRLPKSAIVRGKGLPKLRSAIKTYH